ncbi:tape measure protein [Lysinibacillus xylanilyticus]|uniref:tape measure protein n=1 Tax=Lysinibacillus xylanilyticus TaxID=582475 RepID=UPI00083CA3A5|nr:tape measure protein [Lysinibacillus xylanilyticus]
MATIRTAIQIQDQLSQPMRAMHNAVSMMVNQMEAMHAASGQMMDTSSIELARRELAMAENAMNRIESEVNNATAAQQRFTNNIRDGTNAADGLLNKIIGIAAAYLSFQAVGNVFAVSDELTNTTARLDLINDKLQTTDELQQMIFDSAQRSRGSYSDTADMVAKLAMNAKDAFKSNAETIAFGELLNKQFVIAGTNIEGVQSATLQLTQAMGSGVLRGEELNAVFEATPNVIQTIADYLDVSIGQIRKMASDGKITADIVKASMFAAADDINKKFESMPMTWAQLWTSFKNEALWAFQGVLVKLNEIANSDRFQQVVANTIAALNQMADVAMFTLDTLAVGGSFIYDNWSIIEPAIWGVTAALIVYNATMGIAWFTTLKDIATKIWSTMVSWAQTAAILGLIVAQNGLNAALYACPLTWIIILVIALIAIFYLAIAVVNHFAGTSISATGIIAGAFMVLGTVVYNVIAYMWNMWASYVEFFVNAKKHGVYAVKRLLGNLANNALDMAISMIGSFDSAATNLANMFISGANMAIQAINWVIDALNKVPGIDIGKMSEFSARTSVTADLSKLKKGVNDWVGETPADYWEAPKMEMKSLGSAWDTGYNWGADLFNSDKNTEKVKGPDNVQKAMEDAMKNANANKGAGAGDLGDKLDKGNRNGGKTAGNTAKMAKSMEGSGEDLKYLRDIAEREAINRYTTAEINIDMKNENHINSEMDIDGVIDRFGERAEEVADMLAEGGPTEDV